MKSKAARRVLSVILCMATIGAFAGCCCVKKPKESSDPNMAPSAEVVKVVLARLPKDADKETVLRRSDFNASELEQLDTFANGVSKGQRFESLTLSKCGECRTGADSNPGIWLTILGMRFCVSCGHSP